MSSVQARAVMNATSRTEPDLPRDAKLIAETCAGLHIDGTDLETGLICYAMLEEASRNLAVFRQQLAEHLADQMDDKRVTIEGVGTFERHRKADRKEWNREALLRDVLDTRIVNANTGEIRDETPLEKVLAVWNLPAPRLTAVRERGLDPEDYCVTRWGGYTLQVIA